MVSVYSADQSQLPFQYILSNVGFNACLIVPRTATIYQAVLSNC